MRSETDLIKSWYEYNSNVRKKYLRVIFTKIPDNERYKDRGASFPSIVEIFVHVLDAYRWWFLFVYFDQLSDWKRLRSRKHYSMQEVAEEEKKIDTYIMDFVRKLKPRDLDNKISYKDRRKVERIELREMLLHMIEEELQHRGELNALFWQLNINPPVTGYNEWMREGN